MKSLMPNFQVNTKNGIIFVYWGKRNINFDKSSIYYGRV